MSVGDTTVSNSHTVDLVQEPIVQGGALVPFFCTGSVGGGATLYMFPGSNNLTCSVGTAAMPIPVSFSGTVKNLYVSYSATPTNGSGDKFTVLRCPSLGSCSPTSVLCTVPVASKTCSDPTDTVSVSQGDGIVIEDSTGMSSMGANPRVSIEIQ